MEKRNSNVYRKFGLINFTVLRILEDRTEIINAFKRNGSRIKRLRKPE